MTVEKEIKNFKAFRKQVNKMILYLSENRFNLTAHLLVRSYKYIISLGKKYANNQQFGGYCTENPYWAGCFSLGSKEIDLHPSKCMRNYISVFTSKIGFNLDTTFGSDFLALSKDKYGKAFVVEKGTDGCDFDTTVINNDDSTLVKHFIVYMKLLKKMLNLAIKKDHKKLGANGSISEERQKKQAIKNGKYSWDKIFN